MGGYGRAKGESLSQWEMTNAICPEHSACVNPWRVPAGPHPTLRPLQLPHAPSPPNTSSTSCDGSAKRSSVNRDVRNMNDLS